MSARWGECPQPSPLSWPGTCAKLLCSVCAPQTLSVATGVWDDLRIYEKRRFCQFYTIDNLWSLSKLLKLKWIIQKTYPQIKDKNKLFLICLWYTFCLCKNMFPFFSNRNFGCCEAGSLLLILSAQCECCLQILIETRGTGLERCEKKYVCRLQKNAISGFLIDTIIICSS